MSAQVFGLDIGRSFIKAVAVSASGGKKMLVGAAMTATPAGGMQSDSPADLEKITEAVRACRESAKIDSAKCVVSIIESQVVTRLVTMPRLTDKELSAAIHWESEKYIPLPLKDVNLQYKVLSRPTEGTGQMEVLLIAAPKKVVEKYLTVVKKAGLEPLAVETESTALARALTRVGDSPVIIVSFGAVSTEMVLAHEGNVFFTRSIAAGGATLTKSISTEFNLPVNQAEEYKHSYGLLADKLGGRVAGVLKPTVELVAGEILKAVEFSHTHSKAPVSRIMIGGGGALLPGLEEFLAARTSMEVSLADPWSDFVKDGLILKMPGQGAVYAVATGLALRN